MSKEIKEAISLLRKNGYIVKKWTKDMEKDSNECVELESKGESMNCCGCSCNICLMQ